MKKENNYILKSSFFLKLYGIPALCWLVISLISMIPDETDPEPLSWSESIATDLFVLVSWFAISFVIALIVSEIKKKKPKTIIKEVQPMIKSKEQIIIKDEKNENNTNKEKEKRLNDKALYSCESIIDGYEYKKMAKYFPKRMYWVLVIRGLFLNLIFSAIIAILSKSLISTLIFFIIYQIYLMINYKLRLEYYAEKVFNARKKQGIADTKIETEFYDDYFIRKGESISLTIKYSDICKCVETDTNFYLEYPQQNTIVILQKNSCDLELVSFIRKKFENVENHICDKSNFERIKEYHHPNLIKNGMIILFIITIASLWGALYSVALIDGSISQHGFDFVRNMWVLWCWLPIPILSIILGFKFKNAGFKCTKNIVGGFIIGFLLLIYGSFCMFPTFSEDYSKINQYKEIIDVALPNNGTLEIQDWGTYFDEDKTEYTIINAYYDKEDVRKLVENIENSENWVLSKKIKSELKIFVPSQLRSDDDAYYSIYNKTTNQYNTLPESSGNYEVYAMKYDKSDKHLEIHKFKISYIK